ncbi:RHS repeat domain-containing protein, partial [Melghirimyces profundicolus]|uniref:RHS repeat domain-containing protein n=1 Tax=Melghirimyces profundicolus TaxID=1242148 RepID=UPI001475CDB5
VEVLTDENGNTRATYGYTAYGKPDEEEFTGVDKPDPQTPDQEPYNVYRFNAKRWDPTTGKIDMGFRDYDPGLNRFLTRDMYNGALADMNLAMDPWNMNRYAFAGGNPVTMVELDGHIPDGFDGSKDPVKDYEEATGRFYTPDGPGLKTNWYDASHTQGHSLYFGEVFDQIINDLGLGWTDYIPIGKIQRKTFGFAEKGLDEVVTKLVREYKYSREEALKLLPSPPPNASKEFLEFWEENKHLLYLGEFAEKGVYWPKGKSRNWTSPVKRKNQEIGEEFGCHSCGSKDAKNIWGTFIRDHNPANAINEGKVDVYVFPHCDVCSKRQGRLLSIIKREVPEFMGELQDWASNVFR